ncbi:hypothetical protein NLI96_g3275 [Meripilus lineatus]|uniref:Uncharacterized protein n=1 Tax=Meripilus lineatus TaxID=2056292 RepID=A0AAD5V9A8_9APHY|nr:hypothetical protein NLI96_g3275 [Physisporinus lineatus]
MAAVAFMAPTSALRVSTLSATQFYPSDPMASIRPQCSLSPQSLRERCGIALSLSIAPPVGPPKGDIQPSNKLPRRRKTKVHVVTPEAHSATSSSDTLVNQQPELVQEPKLEVQQKAETIEIETPVPAALNASKVVQVTSEPKPDSSLQELIPGLYIAFSNEGPKDEQPGDSPEKPYTHIVNITHPTQDIDENFKGSAHESYDHQIRRLHLVLPKSAIVSPADGATTTAAVASDASPRSNKTQRAGLGLTDLQLRVARDFLDKAMPRSLASSAEQTSVRVLITTPHGRPTDAMCAAACYLAFTSGQSAHTILRFVDEEEDFLSVWKGEVSEDEITKTEKIARKKFQRARRVPQVDGGRR